MVKFSRTSFCAHLACYCRVSCRLGTEYVDVLCLYVAISAFTLMYHDLGYCNLCWDSQIISHSDPVSEKKTHRTCVCVHACARVNVWESESDKDNDNDVMVLWTFRVTWLAVCWTL